MESSMKSLETSAWVRKKEDLPKPSEMIVDASHLDLRELLEAVRVVNTTPET